MGRLPAGGMMRALLVVLFAVSCATPAMAQRLGTTVEVFGTASFEGGVVPVKAPSGSHIAPSGGIRIDGGLQFPRFAGGLGFGFWQMVPTNEYGGEGVDVFVFGEWRVGGDTRTTLRGSLGYGGDTFDSGHGAERPNVGGDGSIWSIGIGRDVITPFDTRLHLTADVVVPSPMVGSIGRGSPMLQLGIGYRASRFQSISPLP